MGSSYVPTSGYFVSYPVTGPTGPTGDRGNTGSTGFGPRGNTGNSIITMGICGDKLRTIFSDGSTYETPTSIKGPIGDTRLFLGVSSPNISIFSGPTQDNLVYNFRTIRGRTSTSGRATVTIGLTGASAEFIHLGYVNNSSGFTLGISGSSTINTFVGYSGSTLVSIPKTIQGDSSSFLASNVFEKARGLGFSGATNSSGLPCNYITGGTIGYGNSVSLGSVTGCQFIYIDPDCETSNSVDLGIRNKVFFADMQGKITLVRIGKSFTDKASTITIALNNSNNLSAPFTNRKKFDVHGYSGSILWPFSKEPCFCGETGMNVYHLTNLGGNTWYGSVAYMSNPNAFWTCTSPQTSPASIIFGACCLDDGSVGGTCSSETYADCLKKGSRVFWHSGLTCGGSPCSKTGSCKLSFTSTPSENSILCLQGITCINCISGRVYDSAGNTYNAVSFTYLGNGSTCSTEETI